MAASKSKSEHPYKLLFLFKKSKKIKITFLDKLLKSLCITTLNCQRKWIPGIRYSKSLREARYNENERQCQDTEKYHLCSFIHSNAELTEVAMKRRKIEIILSVHHVLRSLQSEAITVWMNSDNSASVEQKNRVI